MTLKLTKQRKKILDLIRKSQGHMTADMIHHALKQENVSIGIATVYRNLNLLYDERYVNRILHPELGYVYDKNVTDHYHFYCRICHTVMDIDLPYKHELDVEASKIVDGEIISHSVIFEGICNACKDKEES